mgnify:FL=1
MNRVLQILVALAAIMFILTGVRWLVAPAGVAPMFGLTLGDGVGLSSQVGDMSAFFLTLGICMLVALVSGRRVWFYPPIILLSLTALGRVIAWLVHDAALAVDLIAPEVIVAALLLVASRRLPEQA